MADSAERADLFDGANLFLLSCQALTILTYNGHYRAAAYMYGEREIGPGRWTRTTLYALVALCLDACSTSLLPLAAVTMVFNVTRTFIT